MSKEGISKATTYVNSVIGMCFSTLDSQNYNPLAIGS